MADTKTKKNRLNPLDLNNEHIILWFDDLGTGNETYRFLSNFYRGDPIILPGVTWDGLLDACGKSEEKARLKDWKGPVAFATGEHAFAAMKFWGTDYTHFYDIVSAPDPNSAKALGRSRQNPLRADWEVVKLDVMAGITREKYTLDREEGQRLLDTGDRMLVEGTFWYDEVWGVDLNSAALPGRNWLGTLLMARRAELHALKMSNRPVVQRFGTEVGVSNTKFGRTFH